MYAVHDPIGPDGPIRVRSDVERVPSAADEARAAARQLDEFEFAAGRAKRAVQVWRVKVAIGR